MSNFSEPILAKVLEFETESTALVEQAKQGDRVRLLAGAGTIIPLAAGTISNPICLVGALLSVGAYTWQVLAESHSNNQPPRLFPSFAGYGDKFLEGAWSDIPSRSALASLYREIGKAPIVHWLESLPAGEQATRLHQLIECRASLSDAMADADADEAEEIYAERMAVIKRVLGLSGSSTATPSRPGGTPITEDPTPHTLHSALPDLFDWSQLQSKPDLFPHLLLLGKTGAGKSFLAERLLGLLPGNAVVVTPHWKPSDFVGVEVIGKGRDYPAISTYLDRLHNEMNQRYALYSQGNESYPWLNVCIDEFPAIAANCGKDATAIVMALAREARKVRIRLIILSQGAEVKALGIEGQGSVRECFTFIRLRGFVEDYAKRLKDQILTEYLAACPYPCMVEDVPADTARIPVSIHRGTPAEPQFSKVQHPVEAEIVEPESEVLMLTGSPISYDASRLLAWLQRKGVSQISLRDLASGRPLGKVAHDSQTLQPLISELLRENLISVDLASKEIVLNC